MKKVVSFLSILLAALLILCSCELFYDAHNGSPSFEHVNIIVYGNDYSGSRWKGAPVNPLCGTVNDATQVGHAFEALAEKAGLESNARYILGKNTNRKGVGFSYAIPNAVSNPDTNTSMAHFKDVLAETAEKSTERDLTIVFISCHGFYDDNVGVKADYGRAKETYFVTSSNTGDECTLYSHSDFLEDVSAISGVKLVIADVCHSGGIVKPGYISVVDGEYSNASAGDLFFEGTKIDIDNSLYCLSSSRYFEQSFEYRSSKPEEDRTHGYFTAALLDALGWNGQSLSKDQKAAKNGAVTFQGLASYVSRNDGSDDQKPMFSDGSADLVLFSL